jgi:hypothetical protein
MSEKPIQTNLSISFVTYTLPEYRMKLAGARRYEMKVYRSKPVPVSRLREKGENVPPGVALVRIPVNVPPEVRRHAKVLQRKLQG